MSYESVDSGGKSLLSFSLGYSELQGVVFALGSATNSHARITLNAAPGQTISLLGFDLGAWKYPSDTSRFTTLSVKNGNSSQDYDAPTLKVLTTTSSHIDTTYFGAAGAGQTVTLEWKNDAFNVGLDNLHFSVTQVPEPETYALLLAGLGLLGAATRKKRHTA
ncbi:MAG: PEP-CTERM sorting domain-containing protein [Burkholderiales bacterium]|nr:PEP-CTERM sorting domain-containing protein [Burkholderiales bacterium]